VTRPAGHSTPTGDNRTYVHGVTLEPEGAADHPLRRDPVDAMSEWPHEVAIPARGDVGAEAVRLQVAQQLHHGSEPARQVGAAQHRVKGRGRPLHDLRAERLHPHAGEGRLDRALEQLQLSVIT
jgi:hypothetical protein